MSKATKEWARKARRELLAELGAWCHWCHTTENLTFDCIIPTGDDHHRGSTDQRMSFYRREHREHNNVQVLCHNCNSRKGDDVIRFIKSELNWEHPGELAPF
ncbi:MAG: hypothetical protein U1F65_05825 [Verrucomicrobiota bacterium]